MKCLYFFFSVAVTQGFVTRVTREVKGIPAPTLAHIDLIDDPGLAFIVHWTPVASPDGADPVLGYKVKVWEKPKVSTFEYEALSGAKRLVDKLAPVKLLHSSQEPKFKPREIVVNGADKSTAMCEGIETETPYEVRVQAFSRAGDGALSQPLMVQICKDCDSKRNLYTVV
ncbi:uncharacterized protein LOC135074066 [Ostrinia nubilalis]|uniref:uncharacterized protein LOC135074066 n=1 Tax=Ostrinia nubilalis TaxID=29057 RepID=UPI00308248CF